MPMTGTHHGSAGEIRRFSSNRNDHTPPVIPTKRNAKTMTARIFTGLGRGHDAVEQRCQPCGGLFGDSRDLRV